MTPSLTAPFKSPSMRTRRLSRVTTLTLHPTLHPTQIDERGRHVPHGALIRAHAIDQRAGGADLHAGAAVDAGAFAQRHAHVGHEHGVRAALFDGEREVADQFTAGAHAAAAQDAAVVVQHEIRVRGIHREDRPVGLDGPVGHAFVVGGVLQFAVAAADLAERTEVIAFAEQHGQHELARLRAASGVSVRTTMPLLTGSVQEACIVRKPSTSTTHRRQPP